MAFDTYANLKTAIVEELDRDDLTSKVDDFIDLAEARHKRDIRIREMLNRDSITVNARQIALPSGFLECQSLRILTSPVSMLTYLSEHELMRVRQSSNGLPRYFTVRNEIEFDTAPDSSYSGEIVFYKEEAALSDANASNNILARSPDAYFYAALLASAPHLMNDERLPVWAGLYREAVEGLSKQRRQERQVGPIVARVAGSTP